MPKAFWTEKDMTNHPHYTKFIFRFYFLLFHILKKITIPLNVNMF